MPRFELPGWIAKRRHTSPIAGQPDASPANQATTARSDTARLAAGMMKPGRRTVSQHLLGVKNKPAPGSTLSSQLIREGQTCYCLDSGAVPKW